MTQANVVVVGLGPMGGAMAGRLVSRGRAVLGVDLDPDRASSWAVATGGRSVSSLGSVDWAAVDLVVVAVRTADQVDSVLAHEGVRAALGRGGSSFVVTTLAPTDARAILDRHRGLRVFELPVSGGVARAERGDLTGLVHGPDRTPDEAAVLDDLLRRVVVLEAPGQPSMLKLVNNTVAAHNLLGAAVAVTVARREGLDPGLATEVIASSSGSSAAGDALRTLTYDDAELLLKDVRLLVRELDASPLGEVTLDDLPATFDEARRLLDVDAARSDGGVA